MKKCSKYSEGADTSSLETDGEPSAYQRQRRPRKSEPSVRNDPQRKKLSVRIVGGDQQELLNDDVLSEKINHLLPSFMIYQRFSRAHLPITNQLIFSFAFVLNFFDEKYDR
jgi:hypothetical protein